MAHRYTFALIATDLAPTELAPGLTKRGSDGEAGSSPATAGPHQRSRRFKLADFDPAETFELPTDIEQVRAILADGVARLEDMQERLYAHGRCAVLIVLQGMDAAGKDGVIKHVMAGINPQGCSVHAFKAPSAEELAHNFLWRIDKYLPERGRIGIFNRSHYEEVLAVRVHPDLLERQKLPPSVTKKNIWKHRFQDIRAFERHLTRNGTLVLKFHLRISKKEQRKRFLARLNEPEKRWKFFRQRHHRVRLLGRLYGGL